jgi:hypothetical protein
VTIDYESWAKHAFVIRDADGNVTHHPATCEHCQSGALDLIQELPTPGARKIPSRPNSNDGVMPANDEDCPYRGEICCVSRSGDSMCGGYSGDAGNGFIYCEEPDTFPEE